MSACKTVLTLWTPLLLLITASCVGAPEVRSIYEDVRTSVRLQEDREAGAGHSHPTRLSPLEVAKLLGGVRVVDERYALHELIAGSAPAEAAFNLEEIRALAPAISKALSIARPNELVTFYRRYTSEAVALAYTSGGLFARDGHLYVVLANYRQPPSDVMRRGIPDYERDPIDDPLLSLLRGQFSIFFSPQEAEVHLAKNDWTWFYPEPGKVIVIDTVLATHTSREAQSEPSASHQQK